MKDDSFDAQDNLDEEINPQRWKWRRKKARRSPEGPLGVSSRHLAEKRFHCRKRQAENQADNFTDDDELKDGEGSTPKTFSAPLPMLSMATPLSQSIHALALRRDLVSNIFVSNDLITSYTHADNLSPLEGCSTKCSQGTSFLGTQSSLATRKAATTRNACNCIGRWKQVLTASVLPNVVTVLSVLQACSRLVNLAFGLEVHRFAVETAPAVIRSSVSMQSVGSSTPLCKLLSIKWTVMRQLEFLAAADLILVLRDGKVVQSGKYLELIEETDGELVQQMATHNETLRSIDENDNPILTLMNQQEKVLKIVSSPLLSEAKEGAKDCLITSVI
ncbi:hypothetical protein ZIOFF_036699 [Zingiber officinale]|uniref:Uncharacterized protein n=1 Tax=Zingiber officinale TaxID=94328 RepID=A0A8J5GIY2_ZINOF|nr:hypothetical protein ZIOFF_036699 [Zingiber officinale]